MCIVHYDGVIYYIYNDKYDEYLCTFLGKCLGNLISKKLVCMFDSESVQTFNLN